MNRFITLIISILSLNFLALSQNYNELGLRAGGTSGFTFRSINPSGSALEGIVELWDHGVSFTSIYEIQNQVGWHSEYPPYIDYGTFGLGTGGIFGINYKIPKTPLLLVLNLIHF